VFERMAAELRAKARLPSVTVRVGPGELIDRMTMLHVPAERPADRAGRTAGRCRPAGTVRG
jgi:hypothetical protein